MIEQLFGSKTRVKLLKLFFRNPNRSFYVREMTRKIEEQINSVRRELANLLSVGIISSDTNNNRLYYEVNQKFEHYDALRSIFADKKYTQPKKDDKKSNEDIKSKEAKEQRVLPTPTEEAKDQFIEALTKSGNIDIALYTGQFTRDELSGVDILVVGDVNGATLESLISDFEQTEKKRIRYCVLSPEEYRYRKQINDRFVTDIALSKKIVFINKDNLL